MLPCELSDRLTVIRLNVMVGKEENRKCIPLYFNEESATSHVLSSLLETKLRNKNTLKLKQEQKESLVNSKSGVI